MYTVINFTFFFQFNLKSPSPVSQLWVIINKVPRNGLCLTVSGNKAIVLWSLTKHIIMRERKKQKNKKQLSFKNLTLSDLWFGEM